MLALLVALLPAWSLPSQTALELARAAANQTPAGFASVSGVVSGSEDSSGPIDGAVVSVTALESQQRLSALSDGQGRFYIGAVPPGMYVLSATRTGYLPVAYGASRPSRPGVALTLKAGQHLGSLGLRMIRGGLIAGRVVSEMGEGVPGASVAALPMVSSWPSAPAVATVTTDGQGRYRLFDLPPGDYAVIVRSHGSDEFREIVVMSSSQIADAIADLERRQSGSERAVPLSSAPRLEPRYGLGPVFYPGVIDPSHAAEVAVGPGQQRNDVDVIVVARPLAGVSGTVVGSAEAAAAGVVLTLARQGPSGLPLYGAAWARPRVARLGPDGRFAFTGVEPGRYLLEAWTTVRRQNGGTRTPSHVLWESVAVDVAGADLAGLTLVLQPTPKVEGRIRFEASSRTSPSDLTTVRVSLSGPRLDALRAAAVQGFVGADSLPPSAAVTPEGAFTLTGVTPGEYVLDVSPVPSGWRLASVSVDGREVGTSVVVRPSGLPLIEVVFSDRHTSISGTLQVPDGEAASSYVLVIIPVDASLRSPQSRWVRWTRPRSDGVFKVVDLPPGEYVVGAVGDFDERDLLDPAFLGELAESGARFRLREDEETIQHLRIARDGWGRPLSTNRDPLRVSTIGR